MPSETPTDWPAILNGIAALWKPLAFIALLVGLVAYKDLITKAVAKMKRASFRRGANEVIYEATPDEGAPASGGQAAAPRDVELEAGEPDVGPVDEDESAFSKMHTAFWKRNGELAETHFRALQEQTPDEAERIRNQTLYWYLRHKHLNDHGAIEELRRLSTKTDVMRSFVFRWIANCYISAEDRQAAIVAYEDAYMAAETDGDRANAIVGISGCRIVRQEYDLAINRIREALRDVTNGSATGKLYKAAAGVYEKSGDKELAAICLELVVAHEPRDASARFDAAFAQSSVKNMDCVCIHNYLGVLEIDPENQSARNNLGVEYQSKKLPISAMRAYQVASDAGNTLASANLAYGYLNAGFVAAATAILDKAKATEDCHPNVADALAAVARNPDKEEERIAEIQIDGERRAGFMRAFARAYFSNPASDHILAAEWTCDGKRVALTAPKAGRMAAEWSQGRIVHKVEGTMTGRALRVALRRNSEAAQGELSILGSFLSNKGPYEGLGYITEDLTECRLMIFEDSSVSYLRLSIATNS